MAEITDLTTLAKNSVDSNDYFLISNSLSKLAKKISVDSLFPAFATSGTGSEDLWVSVTNKNQLNLKGIKSGDTGLLTVATTTNNIVLTALEAGIDLSLCNNTTSGFLAAMDFSGTITGECPVANGGTGLSTIAKGAVLYADVTDSIASAASSINAQVLMHNSTTGLPVWSSIVAGTNLTADTSVAGVLTLNASLTAMAAVLDMANFNIDLGTGYISADGTTNQGIRVTSDDVFIGDSTKYMTDAGLSIASGGITFHNSITPVIKPDSTTGATSGQSTTVEGGGSVNGAAGNLILKAGDTSGSGNGGNVLVYGGDESSGTAGSIRNYVYDGSGSANSALTILGGTSTPDVQVDTGNLVITAADKGIVHTGSGVSTQTTSATTEVTLHATSGVITTFAATLATNTEVEFTFTNDTIQADSVVLLTVLDANTDANSFLIAQMSTITAGSCTIRLGNVGSGTMTATSCKIHFLVINNS